MRTVGIIAEYNPFHTGHEYHLQEAKKLTGADYAIVVLSPDYVQRGEPALIGKQARTRMALLGGADLVLELPVCYATGSAEYFAEGAVALLDRLGCVDRLCFGCESGDAESFLSAASILLHEPEDFSRTLQSLLRQGATYPAARAKALEAACSKNDCPGNMPEFISSPNNILGTEYCKALLKRRSSITPVPVRRIGSGYHSGSLEGVYCSAAALRSALSDGRSAGSLLSYIPMKCRETFLSASQAPLDLEDFLPLLLQKLLSEQSFSHILDISPELSDRICSLRFSCMDKTFRDIVSLLLTKQMTEARIRRALLHLLLGIRADAVEAYRRDGVVYYAKILGFRKTAAPLLHEIKQKSSIPLIAKNARAGRLVPDDGRSMWNLDAGASHLYRAVQSWKYRVPFCSEYEISPLII